MNGKERYDYVFKLIIIGNTSTGKSCCLHQFVEGKFKSGPTKHTIGVEFGSRVIELNDKLIKLQIWDTAGQERFRSVTRSYYRGAVGALIMYDITNEESYSAIKQWLEDARSLARPDLCTIICGNKCDLADERQVKLLDASRFAQENNSLFLETSALTGENVDQVFTKCAKTLLSRIQDGTFQLDTSANGAASGTGHTPHEVLEENAKSRCYC